MGCDAFGRCFTCGEPCNTGGCANYQCQSRQLQFQFNATPVYYWRNTDDRKDDGREQRTPEGASINTQ